MLIPNSKTEEIEEEEENLDGDDAEERHRMAEYITFRNYCFIIFGYTSVMTILPFIGDTYGDSGAWCWINNSDAGKVWRFLAFYVPVWLVMVAIGYMYYFIV